MPGTVITFYSYKGGTGRSMALANVACLLARRSTKSKGPRILAVDWDLEAPGLHRFFEPWIMKSEDAKYSESYLGSQRGLIDLMTAVFAELTTSKKRKTSRIQREIVSSLLDEYILPSRILNLDLMTAGKIDDEYPRRVSQLDWRELFNIAPSFFATVANELASRYDFVLIDSRTGIADSSGIATMLMPEKLVLVFTPNMQSLTGLEKLARRATAYRHNSEDLRPLMIFPLQSRVEDSEPELRAKWRFGSEGESFPGYQRLFEGLFEEIYQFDSCDLEAYFDEVKIQHVPSYAYGEEIAVEVEKEKDRLSLTRSYESFTEILVGKESPWSVSRKIEKPKPRHMLQKSTYLASISFSYRYKDWVEALHSNLEQCLSNTVEERRVFLDQVDLGSGRSWVSQLAEGLNRADHFILVATPEALATPRVSDEWNSFVAKRRDWQHGRLHLVLLVESPIPPFLQSVHLLDFREHDDEQYRSSLSALVDALLDVRDRREYLIVPDSVEIPPPPQQPLPSGVREMLVEWLAPLLSRRIYRRAISAALGLSLNVLDEYPSPEMAASAAIVFATGDDDPVLAAIRIVDVLSSELEEDDPGSVELLAPIREQIEQLREKRPEVGLGLLAAWLRKVHRDHERLVDFFQQRHELDLLDRVYVELTMVLDAQRLGPDNVHDSPQGSLSVTELLDLDPFVYPWVTRRWVIRGDPGSGKTTLLRHLAARLAETSPPRWVPVFQSLPVLLRSGHSLLERVERQMGRAEHRGLAAVLDREGRQGRLLLLLDGLDEVSAEDREDAETLLREFSERWPRTPVMVATRPTEFRRIAGTFRELQLLPLDRERRFEFLSRWFGRASNTRKDDKRAERALRELEAPGLRDLAGNPLFLTLMALLFDKGLSPSRSRSELYSQVFELLLQGQHKHDRESFVVIERPEIVRAVLRRLAWGMTLDNRDAVRRSDLEERLYRPELDDLREALRRLPRWDRHMGRFLDDVAQKVGILGPHDGEDADWRFWHRTFREALTAERLCEIHETGGESAVFELVDAIAGNESRWAEPFALLAGQVEEPDALVRSLLEKNRALGLRALATAQGVSERALVEILELAGTWSERRKVFEQIPDQLGDPERSLQLIDRLRQRTRDGNDLFFLDLAAATVAERWPDEATGAAARLRARLYDHIPPADGSLFRRIDTPHDGTVALWCEIPAGEGWIGSLEDENLGALRRHQVRVVRSFQLSAVPVTNAQYAVFDPGKARDDDDHPVARVTWYEAVSFCRWLSTVPGSEGARLPTEEEWEYACRAGSETAYWNGEDEKALVEVGWYNANSENRTHRVGEKPANPWGLYDIHGNVWEWTVSTSAQDDAGRDACITVDPAEAPADLAAPPDAGRVIRGGSYWVGAVEARSAFRTGNDPALDLPHGFRVLIPGVATGPP